MWEDGQAFRDLQARLKALAENRASIEAARKVLFSIRYVHCPGGQLGPNRPKNQFSEFCGSTQGTHNTKVKADAVSVDWCVAETTDDTGTVLS